MYSPEKLTASSLKSVETLYQLAGFSFDAAERLATLSLDTVRNGIDDGVIGLKAFAAVKEPREALVLTVGMIEPTLLSGLSYIRGCYGILTGWGASMSALMEEQASSLEGEISTALEIFSRGLPHGGEFVSSTVKAALSHASTAVGEAGRATREVLSVAEANAIRNADAAVKLVSSAARKAA